MKGAYRVSSELQSSPERESFYAAEALPRGGFPGVSGREWPVPTATKTVPAVAAAWHPPAQLMFRW